MIKLTKKEIENFKNLGKKILNIRGKKIFLNYYLYLI